MTKHSHIPLLSGQRQDRESDAAVVACNDYVRMGVGRSLSALWQNYGETTVGKPPAKALRTLEDWSVKFDWQDRASAYDAEVEREKTARLEERRREVMESGLAQDFERVTELKALAGFLKGQIYQEDTSRAADHPGRYPKLWVRDVKSVRQEMIEESDKKKRPVMREIEVFRYNSALVEDFRGVMDDLAKETGGRKTKLEHTGKDDGPIEVDVNVNDARERLLAIITRRIAAATQGSGQGDS
jgi:hypothetical protein